MQEKKEHSEYRQEEHRNGEGNNDAFAHGVPLAERDVGEDDDASECAKHIACHQLHVVYERQRSRQDEQAADQEELQHLGDTTRLLEGLADIVLPFMAL